MPTGYVALGSNVGDRLENFRHSVLLINNCSKVSILKSSNIYQTGPVGIKEQPYFLNAVIKIETLFSPMKLLQFLQDIETMVGRIKRTRWGPREIDLDILAINDFYYNSCQLLIPHPQLQKRKFVLQPFSDIAPRYKPFGVNEDITRLLSKVVDSSKIEFFLSEKALYKKPKRFDCA
jgi:2-amino-4-hydroxy-6-hydroxymethyldihydropteridine diphosphokinase